MKRAQFGEAVKYYRRAALDDPANAAYPVAQGLAEMMRGEFGAAATALRRGLIGHPRPEAIRIDLAAVLGRAALYDDAVWRLMRALEDLPERADFHFVAGFHYMAVGEWAMAARHFKTAEALDPADEAAARLRPIATRQWQRQEEREGAED
ncbi:MAG: hypothetical protein QGH74_05820 [Candidatus Brocadiia bacterium]|jgi:tetratricopeptide (TPR) repeat protein|nr:hypothetical protein [Candidatus Brocadiia bacterium]